MNKIELDNFGITGNTSKPSVNVNVPITGRRSKDLQGKHFGRLVVISKGKIGYNGYQLWNCTCKCGKLTSVRSSRLISGNTKSCGCLRDDTSHKDGGIKDLKGIFIRQIRAGAISRSIEFSVSKEYLWELFLSQKGICALTGLNITLLKSKLEARTASLDRIDSFKGYIEGNVQWVHKDVNLMKQSMSLEKLKYYCNLILHHKNQ